MVRRSAHGICRSGGTPLSDPPANGALPAGSEGAGSTGSCAAARRGATLELVGERCALDWKHLQKIERGLVNLTLVTLDRLAVGLGVELHVLFVIPSRS